MQLKYKDRSIQIPDDGETTFLELAEQVRDEYPFQIILAKIGTKLYELNKSVPSETALHKGGVAEPELTFLTTADRDGHKTYERGATMMLLRAMRHVCGKRIRKLKLEYAIGDALYFSVSLRGDCDQPTDEEIAALLETMREYVRADEKFVKTKMGKDDAVALFRRHGMSDKERLFHYRRTSQTNVYRFGNYYDYYYGYMPPSAGYIRVFDIERTIGGILLYLPHRSDPERLREKTIPQKLFATRRITDGWASHLGVSTVAALNDAICEGRGREIILASEANQEHRIGEIAHRIKAENRRIVMIAGPSSSGKTSFSHRLAIQLGNAGLKAHPIACDNYYLDHQFTPRDENGEFDFECLESLDVELFNRQMTALLNGESVDIPSYNFRTGSPEYNGNYLRIGKEDVLVIEGIHGLNDRLSHAIRPEDKFKIYVSAVTALNIDEHNRVPTTDNREIRQIVRDARTRGTSASSTIARWHSVRHGEEKHIFPFQESADEMFDSAALYELSVLKTFAEPLLFAIPEDAPEYTEAKRLLRFLDYFLGLSCEDVPRNSLIREFIGGSIFPVG
ncbi:MAG: nucleoside kinase [Clostridia bacterium]|nr:nucleoside kinase [Clostridia bacterium]